MEYDPFLLVIVSKPEGKKNRLINEMKGMDTVQYGSMMMT